MRFARSSEETSVMLSTSMYSFESLTLAMRSMNSCLTNMFLKSIASSSRISLSRSAALWAVIFFSSSAFICRTISIHTVFFTISSYMDSRMSS